MPTFHSAVAAAQPELTNTLSAPPATLSRPLWPVLAATGALVLVALGLFACWRVMAAPAPVPDHVTALSAAGEMKVAGPLWVAQVVRPERDALTAVDVLLSAESANLPGSVLVEILDEASGHVLRAARLGAAEVPTGSAWDFRPGTGGERWVTFGFEPIADSAGRNLRVVLTYPDGLDVAGRRLNVLARFPRTYTRGAFYVNGFEAGGTLLLRLASRGTRADAISVAATNLARSQAFGSGTLIVPGVLLGASLALAAAVAVFISRH